MLDHLGISETSAKSAIITGDPDRAQQIARFVGNERHLTAKRGYSIWLAEGEGGDQILIASSGIGSPSVAIVVEELAELGIESIIRIGTCGILSSAVTANDLVVPIGCVRDEGTSCQYIRETYPAVPDFELLNLLWSNLEMARKHQGIVHCKDAYYLEHRNRQVEPEAVGNYWKALKRAGVLATEMESSTLFVISRLRGIRSASILISIGTESLSTSDPLQKATRACYESLISSEQLPRISIHSSYMDRRSYLELNLGLSDEES